MFEYAVNFASVLNASIVMLYVMDDSPKAIGVTQGGPMLKFPSYTEEYQKTLKEREENARSVLLEQQAELPLIRSAMEKLSEDHYSSASELVTCGSFLYLHCYGWPSYISQEVLF